MSYVRGVRALGLSLVAVLGLMGLMAGSAGANWLVLHNGVVVEPDVTLSVKVHKEIILLVPAQNLEILCLKAESDPTAPILLLEKSTVGHGHIVISECTTIIKKVISNGCKPTESLLGGGLLELILHNAKNYILLKALAGKPLFHVKFDPVKCALLELSEVTGSLVFECGKLVAGFFTFADCREHEVTHLLQQAPQALFPSDTLKFGLNTMLLDGILDTLINGPALYVGDAWGGHV